MEVNIAVRAENLKITMGTLKVFTERGPQFVDITDAVVRVVKESGVKNGLAVVFSKHTTAAIRINENEPGLIEDMERLLYQLCPREATYQHNINEHSHYGEDYMNGHSHCQHVLLSTSETIPIQEGQLLTGPYQCIFLVELDRAREREVLVQVLGQ